MQEPDYSKIFPKRFITMSMADKYTAVCFIYDGIQYQNLCRIENPDGTFNYSEKCLSKLPFKLPYLDNQQNLSLVNERGLVPYREDTQADFPDIRSAIQHYWFHVLLLCFVSILVFNLAFMFIRRRFFRNRSGSWLDDVSRFMPSSGDSGSYSNGSGRESLGSMSGRMSAPFSTDDDGNIRIGKLSFLPKSPLGLGSKGTCVYKGTYEDSIDCAVKRVVSQYLTMADREIDFLRGLQHPNLVRYLATEWDAQFVYIALELAEFSLYSWIEDEHNLDIGLSREELCQQAAMGLRYLHKLDIVHRDIKPQNILISLKKPQNERRVMISDFGLSKQLSSQDTGHTSSVVRYFDGTQGWIAPEIVNAKLNEDRALLPTKSADIFSLGCVFYYVISNGKHPFGNESRQNNILANKSNLEGVLMASDHDLGEVVGYDRAMIATQLIKAMIDHKPDRRPPIETALEHPTFWSVKKKLQFLSDVSDRLDQANTEELITSIDRGKGRVIGFEWKENIHPELLDNARARRTYNYHKITQLLRLIRNKKNHFMDMDKHLRDLIGEVPDGYCRYFTSRFPELIPWIYKVMQVVRDESIFRSYYGDSDNYVFH